MPSTPVAPMWMVAERLPARICLLIQIASLIGMANPALVEGAVRDPVAPAVSTLMLSAPLIRWLFVMTTPDASSTIPVPAACTFGWLSWVLMSTRPGSTLAASAGRSGNTLEVPGERGGVETGRVAGPLAAGGVH